MGIVAGASAALAALTAGGYAIYRRFLDATPEAAGSVSARLTAALLAPRPADADSIARYADSPSEWTAIPASGLPAGARKVPIRERRWTSLAPSRANDWPRYTSGPDSGKRIKFWQSRSLFLAVITDLRAALAAAGRADEDVRCVLWLHALETGYGQSFWDYNCGNRKTRPYASRALILSERSVFTTNQFSDGVILLVDRVRSFDSYPSYPTLDAGLRDERRFFETSRGNGRGYGDVLPGYRQGGIDGLKRARTAQHNGGYSPGSLPGKLASCDDWWALGTRILGSDWRR